MPPQPVGFDTAVRVPAHREQEDDDLRKGEQLDDEQEPDPIKRQAVMRVRQDGGVKAPPQVPQSDRQHESARNRPRPGSPARPVQDKNQKERRDQQRWAQRF